MKKFISIFLVLTLVFGTCFAHSGRTDSNGGHYNRSTGEYHYHHGYSAHSHSNGVCPYQKPTKSITKPSIATTTTKTNYSEISTESLADYKKANRNLQNEVAEKNKEIQQCKDTIFNMKNAIIILGTVLAGSIILNICLIRKRK